jgi:hypothetical protein
VMRDAMVLFEDQVAKGNEKFVERFMASNQMNRTLLEEVKHRCNKRSMPRTWGRCRHPATMYLKWIANARDCDWLVAFFFFFITWCMDFGKEITRTSAYANWHVITCLLQYPTLLRHFAKEHRRFSKESPHKGITPRIASLFDSLFSGTFASCATAPPPLLSQKAQLTRKSRWHLKPS